MPTPTTITVRINPAEYRALKYLAEVEEQPISTLMKEIALEKAENDYYYRLAEEALREHEKDPQTYTHAEMMKRYA